MFVQRLTVVEGKGVLSVTVKSRIDPLQSYLFQLGPLALRGLPYQTKTGGLMSLTTLERDIVCRRRSG